MCAVDQRRRGQRSKLSQREGARRQSTRLILPCVLAMAGGGRSHPGFWFRAWLYTAAQANTHAVNRKPETRNPKPCVRPREGEFCVRSAVR